MNLTTEEIDFDIQSFFKRHQIIVKCPHCKNQLKYLTQTNDFVMFETSSKMYCAVCQENFDSITILKTHFN